MPKITDFKQPPNFPELEEQVQAFWRESQVFEKSVEMRPADKSYVFYDGPPFATGMPHYGHLLASTTKDVVPRYWTMKGYRVERVWGWDCHGVPIEHMIEKKLEIKGGKKGIEELGVHAFNSACRAEVLRLDKEWERIVGRLGRWVDFEHNYKTMDATFMESVWWGFKQLFDKGLVYQGRKVVLFCPRCATPLSNFEIAMDNSYQDVVDNSVFVKFKLKDKNNEFFLAWTTTPWTLPGNVALAVDATAEYVQVETENGELLWVAEKLAQTVLGDHSLTVKQTVTGQDLVGVEYEPLFNYVQTDKKAWYVLPAGFVSLENGTGIVHTAAIFGEDDYALALENDLPLVPTLSDEGKFLPFVELVAGLFYKKAEQTIIDDLQQRNLMFRAEKITHSYPFCYRCATPLFYNAVPAWFIDVKQLRSDLIAANEDVNWVPKHLKHGRFMKGLEGAPDWNISRSRYWGTPMPIWTADDQYRVIGSLEELKKWAVNSSQVDQLTDIHREYLDDVEVWIDEARTLKGKRIPEVFDCWVESGSMPFASLHYPFEHKQQFESNFPAQFVSEYIAQTRAWFYTMHVLSVGIFGKPSFENVLTTGTILAEDGSKMSKSKNNYPDPMLLINKYGVDSLRLYLMSSPVMKSENLNFSEKDVGDIRRKVFVIWWNVFAFYQSFADTTQDFNTLPAAPSHILDQWVLSRLGTVVTQVTAAMDAYDLVKASRLLISFVDELSTWYLRLSRERIKVADNQAVSQVFGHVLYTLAKLFAPLTPFFSEIIHQTMVDKKTSIHHTNWPETAKHQDLINSKLETEMIETQAIVEAAHAQRKEAAVKVRQPLATVMVKAAQTLEYQTQLESLLLDELNVKQVNWEINEGHPLSVKLDLSLTPELKAEGEAREIMRNIQKLRKEQGLEPQQQAVIQLPAWPAEWQTEIERKTNSSLKTGSTLEILPG